MYERHVYDVVIEEFMMHDPEGKMIGARRVITKRGDVTKGRLVGQDLPINSRKASYSREHQDYQQ